MAQFTVRIELHGASSAHYDLLHERMEAANFKRALAGIDSSGAQGWWQLPTGEYDFESTGNVQLVRDQAKMIADSVKPGAWVLVTEVANRSWSTLKLHNR